MSVKYLKFELSIHGLDMKEDYSDALKGWVKESVKAFLTGHSKELFNFRNEFDGDIEMELIESAGQCFDSVKHPYNSETKIEEIQLRHEDGTPLYKKEDIQ